MHVIKLSVDFIADTPTIISVAYTKINLKLKVIKLCTDAQRCH